MSIKKLLVAIVSIGVIPLVAFAQKQEQPNVLFITTEFNGDTIEWDI